MELLRLHAARASQSERYAPATKVIDGAISLAQKLADEKGVEVRVSGDTPRRAAMVEKNATRQVILATLDLVLGPMQGGRLEIHYTFKPDSLEVVCVARCEDVNADRLQHREADPKVLGELAQSQQIALHPIERNGRVEGFCLQVPTKRLTTILVVDDNDDMLGLFERYLRSHDYGVIKARRGREAISLARSHQPDVILLDLMIPDQDGWEVLQTLSNQPGTERIPIMVCTVLSAKRLALALGAAVFLEKPITEDKLISALASVDEKSSGGSIQ
jgi:CheY-like chemotaxis protein